MQWWLCNMYAEELQAFCPSYPEFNPGSADMFIYGLEQKWYLPKEGKWVWLFFFQCWYWNKSDICMARRVQNHLVGHINFTIVIWSQCQITIPKLKLKLFTNIFFSTFLICSLSFQLLYFQAVVLYEIDSNCSDSWFRRSSWLIPCQQSWPCAENRTSEAPLNNISGSRAMRLALLLNVMKV